ncbi:MAG: ATP-binding protein, partial [Streptosporangiaceae bacterium]
AAGLAARLTEARERASLDLIEAGLALGETEQPIAGLRALTAADPLAERPRGLLMRALAGSGRRAEALALYEQTRGLLADRLGVDPSPRLERIYLDILRQDLDHAPGREPEREPTAGGDETGLERQRTAAGDPPPPGAAIRRPLTSFVGRADDVARVLAMLASQRLVTLTGPGGAGKTRLAVELAAGLADDQDRRPWRPWFVDLTPVTDADDVPYAVLHALGVRDGGLMARSGSGPPAAPTDPVTRLAAVLGSGEHLLILDNCEHVVGAAAVLAEEILARCPATRILATSREPLRIGGERLWPVSPLPEPAALRLLTDRAVAVRPDFTADESNAADLARICRAMDGMPLAIELAAARLRALPPAQLAARLDARFQVLTTGSRTAAERHQTLWAVVDWSWELLSAPEQLLARRLAMFAGGATLTAAEQVCQDADLPGEGILPGLLGLAEKSFLVVDHAADPDGDPRYTMLETIRAYCAQRLADSGEEPAVRRRFASHFLDLAQTADPLLRGARQRPWMRRLAAEQDNIGAAVRWALDNHEPDLALRFGQALSWFWLLRGQRRETADLAEEILAVSAPPDGQEPGSGDVATAAARAVCALIALNSNWNLDGLRQPLVAAEHLVLAEVRARHTGEAGRCGYHPLVLLAAIMVPLYDRHDADQALDLIVAHFDAPDPWTRWAARAMHSIFALSLGRTPDVASECAQALAGFRALGDRWGTALTLTSQAELAMLAGDFAAAIADLEEAVSLGRELTDWQDTAQMHAYLAKSRSRLGDRQGALSDLEQAEQIVRANGDPSGDLWIYYIRAELAWLAGDLAEAGAICRKLETMLPDTSPMIWSFRALVEARRGLADLRSGAAGDGAGTLLAALGHARESMDRSAVATVLDALAAAVLAGPDPG